MRVCILIVSLDAFKGGNHLPLLAALHDVSFTILTNRKKPVDAVLPPNVEVIELNERLGPFYYGISDIRFSKAVLRRYPVTDAFWKQFDVVHLNQTIGDGLLALRDTGRPVLYTVHHPVTVDRQVALQEDPWYERLRWWAKYVVLIRAQRRLCRGFSRVMTVSHTSARRIADDYGIPFDKISVVYNGVNGTEFTLADATPPRFDVVALGSFIHPRKGFKHLARVYRLLSERGLRIADVGRRSGAQMEILKTIPGVTSHETIPQEQLVDIVRSSQVLISTAVYEGFGLSLIEALACGKPCFAFAVGAVPEVLEPIDPSLLVTPRNAEEMAEKIFAYLALPAEEKRRKGEEYRRRVLELYTIDASAKSLRDLYASL